VCALVGVTVEMTVVQNNEKKQCNYRIGFYDFVFEIITERAHHACISELGILKFSKWFLIQ